MQPADLGLLRDVLRHDAYWALGRGKIRLKDKVMAKDDSCKLFFRFSSARPVLEFSADSGKGAGLSLQDEKDDELKVKVVVMNCKAR